MKLLDCQKTENKIKIYLCGKKILSYRSESKYDKIYAKRFDGLTRDELEYCVKEQYKKWHENYPDLINPKTFNEKLTWEKLYYNNPLMTICADKVKAREYYLEKTGDHEEHLVKQFGVYDNASEINYDVFPNKFVLKSNWGSGKQIIVNDKSSLDINKTNEIVQTWQNKRSNHYFCAFEYGYKNIEPKIVCEEFLDFEYKLEFFCFNGKPKFFWIVLNDKTDNTQANFYNLDWSKIPVENHYPNFNQDIVKPNCYENILDLATKLCGDFPFVRCDFYITKDSYRFSEMTFFHWGCSQQFEPAEYDEIFGSYMSLPKEKIME